ncbi:MAG: glycosyltransferase family 4 protein [Hyphomicrobiaceae bacterium]
MKSIKVCHAAFAFIENDPRILRSIKSLREADYEVVALGYGTAVAYRPMTALKKLKCAIRQSPAWVLPQHLVLRLYWQTPEVRELYAALIRECPKIIHTHDSETLPAAARAARVLGARLIYDSHEFAQAMRAERLLWRAVFPPYIRAIEGSEISRTDANIAVGPTMAKTMQSAYMLKEPPIVLRNVPYYQEMAYRACNPDRMLLHYHGVVNSGRGLDQLVETLSLLPERFHLRLTGPVRQIGYDEHLQRLVQRPGVAERVEICKPLPADKLIRHAASADIGVTIAVDDTPQKRTGLPNKVFEYAMAGLMVVGGPAPDVRDIITRYRLGKSIENPDTASLARLLEQLTPEQINANKKSSLEAAKALCWEKEAGKLIDLYRSLERSTVDDNITG